MARFNAISLFVAAAAATATVAAASTPSSLPSESGYTYSGNGCPVDSGAVNYAGGDYTAEKWSINGFTSNSTANCEIHLSSSGASAGWETALTAVHLTGKTTLSSGSDLNAYVQVYWSADASDTISASVSIAGPVTDETFEVTLDIPSSSELWSECTSSSNSSPGILNVNINGAVNGDGEFTISSEEWDFTWKEC